MILASKCKLRAGFEVEVCKELPLDASGDADFDRARYSYADFADIEAARAHARAVFPGSPFGCAIIRRFRMEPVSPRHPAVLDREYDESFFEEIS